MRTPAVARAGLGLLGRHPGRAEQGDLYPALCSGRTAPDSLTWLPSVSRGSFPPDAGLRACCRQQVRAWPPLPHECAGPANLLTARPSGGELVSRITRARLRRGGAVTGDVSSGT